MLKLFNIKALNNSTTTTFACTKWSHFYFFIRTCLTMPCLTMPSTWNISSAFLTTFRGRKPKPGTGVSSSLWWEEWWQGFVLGVWVTNVFFTVGIQTWKKTFFCELWNFGNACLAEKLRKLQQIWNSYKRRKSII